MDKPPRIKRSSSNVKNNLETMRQQDKIISNPEFLTWKQLLISEMWELNNILMQKISTEEWTSYKAQGFGSTILVYEQVNSNNAIAICTDKGKSIEGYLDQKCCASIQFETSDNNTQQIFGLVFNTEIIEMNVFLKNSNLDFQFTENINF